jgi:hypothetical protein
MADQKDFLFATRGAEFWSEQLDIAELMGDEKHIAHAARKFFGATKYLVRLAVDSIKAQGDFSPTEADCTGTHRAWQAAAKANDGHCTCGPANPSPHWEITGTGIDSDGDDIVKLMLCDAPYDANDAIRLAAAYSRTVRDKIDAMAAETLCHQAADIYAAAHSAAWYRERYAKQKARRIPARNQLLQRRADRRAGQLPRRPRATPAQKIANRRRRKFGRSPS